MCRNLMLTFMSTLPHPLYCPSLGLATKCQEEAQGQLTLTVSQVWQSSWLIWNSSYWNQSVCSIAYLHCCPGHTGNQVWKEESSEAWPYSCPGAAINRICTGDSSLF